MKLTFLNTREVKKIKQQVMDEFGSWFEGDYAFLMNEKKRIFMINKSVNQVDFDKLRVDRIGLYIGEVLKTKVRLSKEGAQLLATRDVKNKVELTAEEVTLYFQGADLDKDLGDPRFILLAYQGDVLGCASYKEGKILNYLPKIHQGTVIL
jgi:NOL1/NOP2/fmu family ribosome biogenesis protein